jgi:hypothetical protein
MDDNPTVNRAAEIYFLKIKNAARKLQTNPPMPWSGLEQLTREMQFVEEGMNCPTFEQFMNFSRSISFEECRNLFYYSFLLMTTMTSQNNKTFGSIMEYFVKNHQSRKHSSEMLPPRIGGVPPKVYSFDLWELVKKLYMLQSFLIRPVTRSVLSSSRMMMVSPSAPYGFYLRCVMHRMNPRLKLVTVSQGMCYFFVRSVLENAAESGQNCPQIKHILALIFGLTRMNRRMLQYI